MQSEHNFDAALLLIADKFCSTLKEISIMCETKRVEEVLYFNILFEDDELITINI